MSETISLLMNEEMSFIFSVVFSMLVSIVAMMVTTISYSKKKKETSAKTREVYRLVKQNEESEKTDLVKQTMSNIPSGLSKDEYFTKMESILSKLSYTKLKNDDKNTKDKAIEELIRSHHEQALSQASIQFWTSLIASIVGFLFIIFMMIFANNEQWYEYVLKVLPGAIIETVSYLFYKQASETRNRASDFLNRLRNDEQISRSIVIADSINNEELKSLIKAKVALHICGINDTQEINNFFGNNDSKI